MNKVIGFLVISVLISGLSLVTIRNQTRGNFSALNNAEINAQEMQEEFEVLKVRRSGLTETKRIRVESEKYGLHSPNPEEIIVIEVL